MIKVALEKLVNNLILKKYLFLEDFEIRLYKAGRAVGYYEPTETYTFVFYVKPELDGTFTIDDEFEEIEKLSKKLFKIIGPSRYQLYGGVEFMVKNR